MRCTFVYNLFAFGAKFYLCLLRFLVGQNGKGKRNRSIFALLLQFIEDFSPLSIERILLKTED